jgi:hypothetical protein
MDLKYILKVFIILYLIISIISVVNKQAKLLQVATIEGLSNPPDTSIIINKGAAFCESNRGTSGTLDKSCGKLTKNNCNSTTCCVFKSNNKCVAGGENGPTFNTHSNGKTKDLDYYYFLNKCYGVNCPKYV